VGAYVEHVFSGGFLLDEGRLRKISDLIENRSGEGSLIFKVYRGDSFSYETSNIDDVVNEDNEDWRAIKRLDLRLVENHDLDFDLSFSDQGVSIFITGPVRDAVFLVFSDVKEYMSSDVIIRAPMRDKTAMNISVFMMLLVMVVIIYSTYSAHELYDERGYQAVTESGSVNEKLNFIIEIGKNKSDSLPNYWMMIALFFPIIIATGALRKIWNFLFPSNVFIFGDRKKKYEDRIALVREGLNNSLFSPLR